MKKIIAWVSDEKKEELKKANELFNVPLLFVNSVSEIEENMDDYVIFYPPLAFNDKNFIYLLKKYPAGTFNAMCDLYVFDFETTTMLINLSDLLPDNPNEAEVLIKRFLCLQI